METGVNHSVDCLHMFLMNWFPGILLSRKGPGQTEHCIQRTEIITSWHICNASLRKGFDEDEVGFLPLWPKEKNIEQTLSRTSNFLCTTIAIAPSKAFVDCISDVHRIYNCIRYAKYSEKFRFMRSPDLLMCNACDFPCSILLDCKLASHESFTCAGEEGHIMCYLTGSATNTLMQHQSECSSKNQQHKLRYHLAELTLKNSQIPLKLCPKGR